MHDQVPDDADPHDAGDVLVDEGPVVVVALELDEEDEEGGDEESCNERKSQGRNFGRVVGHGGGEED